MSSFIHDAQAIGQHLILHLQPRLGDGDLLLRLGDLSIPLLNPDDRSIDLLLRVRHPHLNVRQFAVDGILLGVQLLDFLFERCHAVAGVCARVLRLVNLILDLRFCGLLGE